MEAGLEELSTPALDSSEPEVPSCWRGVWVWDSPPSVHALVPLSLTYLVLKSSTLSCIIFSSDCRRPLSLLKVSRFFLRALMYVSKKGSRFLGDVVVVCCWRRLHLVSRTLFCCSKNRTYVEKRARCFNRRILRPAPA